MESPAKRLLLVEDEAILALATIGTLKERGYAVERASDGESAIERVDRGGIDLVLMDINLGPGMTGPEAARSILRKRDIPIVFLSSHTEKAIVESTEEISSYGYVVKNSGITVLDASIKMAFRLFESNRKLALSEEKFNKAFRLSPDSVNINRLSDGVYLDINSGFTALTGYAAEDVIGRSSLPGDLGIWARAEDRDRLIRGLRAAGEVSNLVAEFRRKDGSLITGLMSARIVEIEGEQCILSISRDITERKRAEDGLRESESRFRAAFANAPVGMAVLSSGGGLRMINRAFCELLGRGAAEASAVDFKSLIHPDDLAPFEAAAAGLRGGERETVRLLARYLRADGGSVWADESLSLLRDETGAPQGFVVHALDVTERKASEERIAKLDRVRSVVSEAMKLLIRESDPGKLLEGACRIAVEKGMLRMAWVGLLEEGSLVLRPFASAGAVLGYLDALAIPVADTPEGRGPTGTAMRENRIDLCGDIASDPRMAPWREAALERGYRSSAAFPLRSGAGAIGVFTVYSSEIDFFGEEETALLAQLALDISFALDSQRAQRQGAETEARLREGEARYRASFVQSSAIKLLIDPESRDIVDANEAAARFYGYPLEALTRMKITDLNPAPADTVAEGIALARNRRQNRFVFDHRLSSGELREVEIFSSPIEVGGRALLHSIIHDITEQRRAERALEESERRFRTVFASAPVGMSVTGLDGRLAEVNKAFCEMLGRPQPELIASSYARITHPDDLAASDECVRSVKSGAVPSARLVKRYIHADGHHVWADVSIALLRGDGGEPLSFVTHMLDITDRMRAEEGLRRLVAEKETLMKELQHRVKNNLNVVTSLLQFEEDKHRGEKGEAALSDAIARVRSIAAIYERLYLSEDLSTVDLRLYVEELSASIFSTYNLDPDLVALRVSADRILLDSRRAVPLGLMLNELLSNALKYAYPPGAAGEVRVELAGAGGEIRLTVSDDGPGIPPGFLSPDCASMGMSLIRLLARQLGAGLAFEGGPGTRVSIAFASEERA